MLSMLLYPFSLGDLVNQVFSDRYDIIKMFMKKHACQINYKSCMVLTRSPFIQRERTPECFGSLLIEVLYHEMYHEMYHEVYPSIKSSCDVSNVENN